MTDSKVIEISDFLLERNMTLFTSFGMISGELLSTESISEHLFLVLKDVKVYSHPISKESFTSCPEILVNLDNIVAFVPGEAQ